MNTSTQFDPNTLAAVKPAMDSALAEIGACMERYLDAPDANAASLEAAHIELHRLIGVLKMVRLNGAAVFCTELERVLNELALNPYQITGMHRDTLHHALSGIAHFLDALAGGANNAALHLFPQYQELQQLRGLEMAFELDLFYPNLDVQLPHEVLSKRAQGDLTARIKVLRSQYQQGLMHWLRQDDVPAALSLMQQALENVLCCTPPDSGRAFWWIATGMLDCLRLDGLPPELNARKLLGRIDQQMRAVADGNTGDVQPVLNEMLYLVGRSHTVSELVEAIKQVYALDSYLPEYSALPQSEVVQLLDTMRDQLHAAKAIWELCVHNGEGACAKFIEHANRLVSQSKRLDGDSLNYLTGQIQALSQYASDPENAQFLSFDMAMALLLLENGIEHYHNLGDDFQEQARIVSERMLAAVQQQPGSKRLPELIKWYCRMEQGYALAPLANEMLANLHHVEHGLNTFFSDPEKRDELAGLLRLLKQIHGGLHIASLEPAEQLLISIQNHVRRLNLGKDTPKPLENRALANAVSALENFLQHLTHGQAGDTALLQAALAEIGQFEQASAQEESAKTDQHRTFAAVQHPTGEDQELLEIFLEEAQEVLRIMRDNLELCHLHPDSREPLATIRRGFHTLKGSGRMVGLTDLGEVAWCIERAMNKWLQDNKTSTPALLHFINGAVQSFAGWVNALYKHGEVHIEADELITTARQIESGANLEEQPAIADIHPEPDKPESELPGQFIPEIQCEAAPAQDAEPDAFPAPTINMPPDTSAPGDLDTVHEIINETVDKAPEPDLSEPAEPEAAAEPAEENRVVIGEITLTMPLFNIASTEAMQNVAVLQQQLDALRTSVPANVPYDFMRAAHTLAGVNRSMGFADVVELACALENWLQVHMDKAFVPNETQLALLEQSIAVLDVMSRSICEKQMPQARPDLVSQLIADRHHLGGESIAEQAAAEQPQVIAAQPEAVVELPPVMAEQPQVVVEPLPAAAQIPAPDEPAEQAAYTEKTHVQDDVDEQLLPTFLEEADDLCPKIAAGLRTWRMQPHDEQQMQLLKRLLHTLKGSARMTGGMRIGEVVHEMEDRVLAAAKMQDQPGYWDSLESDSDRIAELLEEMRSGKIKVEETVVVEPPRRATDPPGTEHIAERRMLEIGAERALQGNILRVRSDVVDMLVNEAGEISMARLRMETEMRALKESMLEMADSMARMRKQLREIEIQAESQMQARVSLNRESSEQFDPLEFDRFTRLQELTRFMNESVHDVHAVQQSIRKNIDETNAAISAQARISRELQERLMSVRLVPFSSINERLYRVVRQTAKGLHKRANLELIGTDLELDRSVLEKMTAPFEHLLRNMIVHGLENGQARNLAGKDPCGEIRLSLHHENNEIVFELSDDGAGLNFSALREKALARGLLQEGESPSDDQLAQMIFVSGISTAAKVTAVAGRGIGMDVVRSEIAALGGRIDVDSKRGEGTQFTIHLPLTMAVMHTLLVHARNAIYAIPSSVVEQMLQVKSSELEQLYIDRKIEWQDKTYPLYYLPHLLGDTERTPENLPRNQILLLHTGELRMALHVEDIKDNRETVVKNVGPQLARMSGIAGATVLGDGTVVLILNPVQLLQHPGTLMHKADKVIQEVQNIKPLVMVVDDSLTVRKITTRILTRAGYEVVTAKDGVDALEQLAEITPSVMLLDVEMPRMDGFELTKHLRRDAKTRDMPIIMITSRTAGKHRDYAMQLGVNTYLGKPYQEDELLQDIANFMAEHK